MQKVKPPHPPRFLCNNVLEWAFGIVSPSKLLNYQYRAGFGTLKEREREKMEQYNARARAYQAYLWTQRVAARSVTKEEWRDHCHAQRFQMRQLKNQKEMDAALGKMAEAMREFGKILAEGVAKAAEEINKTRKDI